MLEQGAIDRLAAQSIAPQGHVIGGKRLAGEAVFDVVSPIDGKVFTSIGSGFQKIGQGFDKVGQVILHPLETLKGLDPVKSAEWIANGIRNGGNAIANGIVFAAHNPKEAAIIAGAVGRGGKAAEDILLELDIVR